MGEKGEKEEREVKISTGGKNFYYAVFNALKLSTNLTNIQKKLRISKQQLNYYLRQLKKDGKIIHKGRGWYELPKEVKISTVYGSDKVKDISRGHAYVWTVKIKKIPENWDKRIDILRKRNVNFVLVGILKKTPRIKVYGRKIWLCNTHIRVFDKKEASYYGETAKDSKYIALQEIKRIVGVLERKLGVFLEPSQIKFKKEHYALIKNDLAIHENRKGNIWRIRDENGEWMLLDDSLEQGGELETVGKNAYGNNIELQKWWNIKKKHNFEITDDFLLDRFNKFDERDKKFMEIIEKLEARLIYLTQKLNDGGLI